MLRVVFTSAIALDAQPLTACDRLELVVAPEEVVLLDAGAGVPVSAAQPAANPGQEARI